MKQAQSLKNYIEKVKVKKYLPFILLFLYYLLLHKSLPFVGDDLSKREKVLNLAFYNRYFTWSTRLIADTLAVIFSKMPYVIFKVLDSAIYSFIAYCFSKLFNDRKDIKLDSFICLIIAVFPFSTMGTAGWVATSTGYNWPVLACVLAFLPIIYVKQNKNVSKLHLLYAVPCLLYGTDPQALGMLAFGFSAVLFFYSLIKNKSVKKVHWYIKFLFILSLIKLIFTLTSPSVGYRTAMETEKFFKAYGDLNIFQKLYMGYLYTFRMLIIYPWLMITFLVLINYITHINQKSMINKLLSDMVLSIILALTIFRNFVSHITNSFEKFYNNIFMDVISTDIDYYILLLIVITFVILSSIYLIAINMKKDKLKINLIYLAGLASQLIMAFSPTIYASSYRTACFMYFSMIVVNIYLLKFIVSSKKQLEGLYFLLLIPTVIQLIEFW